MQESCRKTLSENKKNGSFPTFYKGECIRFFADHKSRKEEKSKRSFFLHTATQREK